MSGFKVGDKVSMLLHSRIEHYEFGTVIRVTKTLGFADFGGVRVLKFRLEDGLTFETYRRQILAYSPDHTAYNNRARNRLSVQRAVDEIGRLDVTIGVTDDQIQRAEPHLRAALEILNERREKRF